MLWKSCSADCPFKLTSLGTNHTETEIIVNFACEYIGIRFCVMWNAFWVVWRGIWKFGRIQQNSLEPFFIRSYGFKRLWNNLWNQTHKAIHKSERSKNPTLSVQCLHECLQWVIRSPIFSVGWKWNCCTIRERITPYICRRQMLTSCSKLIVN